MTSHSEPIACSLSASQAGDRLTEWSELQRMATSIDVLPDGVRLRIPAEYADQARDLADRESRCCAFLVIAISTVGRSESIEMTIASPNPDGVPVVHLLAGVVDG